jgi:hypothetical protein
LENEMDKLHVTGGGGGGQKPPPTAPAKKPTKPGRK